MPGPDPRSVEAICAETHESNHRSTCDAQTELCEVRLECSCLPPPPSLGGGREDVGDRQVSASVHAYAAHLLTDPKPLTLPGSEALPALRLPGTWGQARLRPHCRGKAETEGGCTARQRAGVWP